MTTTDLPLLNQATLRSCLTPLPEKVLQFGGGAFLRGFADWMIHRLNQAGHFNGSIVLVESTGRSNTSQLLTKQDNLYTVVTRGIETGQTVDRSEIVSSLSRGLDANTQWQEVLACARNPELRLVISNTTEAGIALSQTDQAADAPPESFPAKLAAVLYERFRHFKGAPDKGLIVLPCELIDDNGTTLKRIVRELANRWNLPADFSDWLDNHNAFCNTLVDRIVTGYPKDDAAAIQQKLGYADALLDVAEPFHFFAIEAPDEVRKELPFDQVGLNVAYAADIGPYRTRKVRILNGAHTMLAPAAFLAGHDTVLQATQDPVFARYLWTGLFGEILPALDLPADDARAFAEATLERFANPFLRHQLLAIALNSTSKFKVRVLPTLRASIKKFGGPPPVLTFSLAALLAFYRGTDIREGALIGNRSGHPYSVRDDARALESFCAIWAETSDPHTIVRRALGLSDVWGENLNAVPGFGATVEGHLRSILSHGVPAAAKTASGG